jgi:hypothetical protein
MNQQKIDEIKARHGRALNGHASDIDAFIGIDAEELLAEVERLTAENKALRENNDSRRQTEESAIKQIAALKSERDVSVLKNASKLDLVFAPVKCGECRYCEHECSATCRNDNNFYCRDGKRKEQK